jgi:hypothetical protein
MSQMDQMVFFGVKAFDGQLGMVEIQDFKALHLYSLHYYYLR